MLGISDREAESRFGWFMRALRYGTPPHAGFAVGLDRLVMVLQNEPNIREVMPFPKTQTGYDPMTDSPSLVDEFQLRGAGHRPASRGARRPLAGEPAAALMDDLFAADREAHRRAAEPLAARLRPRTLDEVVGQRHLLAPAPPSGRWCGRGGRCR